MTSKENEILRDIPNHNQNQNIGNCLIICPTHKPKLSKKIFFGEYDRYVRVDYVSHEIAKRLKEHAEANTWFTKELDFTRDIVHWKEIPPTAQRMFFLNIVYQNLMDSGVSNGFLEVFVPLITQPIWQLLYARIGYEETIHAESYSYALNLVFGSDAERILDLVYEDKFVQQRLKNEVDAYKNVIDYVLVGGNKNDKAKQYILEMILRVYFLEGIKFPFSFFIAWKINDDFGNPIQGIARMLKLIAWDELTTHVPTGVAILRILRDEEEQEFSHLFKNGWFGEIATKMAKETAELELSWGYYLLGDNKHIGTLNKEVIEHFIKYMTDLRLRQLGLPPIYGEKHSSVIKWFEDYRNINRSNVALQEADNLAYQKASMKNDLDLLDKSVFF